MNNYLTLIAQLPDTITANLLKSILENNNIFATLRGEHASNVLPINDNTVSLYVLQNDIPKVTTILKEYEKRFKFSIITDIA